MTTIKPRYKDPVRQRLHDHYLAAAADPSSFLYCETGPAITAFWAGHDGKPRPAWSGVLATAYAAGCDYAKATNPPQRGGKRPGAGRKAEDGATGLTGYSVQLPPAVAAWCGRVGAAHIRQLLANACQEQEGRCK